MSKTINVSTEAGEKTFSIRENAPFLWSHLVPSMEEGHHKYSRGSLLVLGGHFYTGAPSLAAYTARRTGAGYVSLFCKTEDYPLYAGRGGGAVVIPYDDIQDVLDFYQSDRCHGALIGPGLTPNDATRRKVFSFLEVGKNILLDAGAISAFEGDRESLTACLSDKCILTPHEGEWRRLFPEHTEGSREERFHLGIDQAPGIWINKGFRTFIGQQGRTTVVNINARPNLATAGTGDVLSGLIGGLWAQGMPPFEAACAAAYLHGEASKKRGRGLIAEDIPDFLPEIFDVMALSH